LVEWLLVELIDLTFGHFCKVIVLDLLGNPQPSEITVPEP
jgi:hypothetical protein